MKQTLLRSAMFILALFSFQFVNAHVWEIRVNQKTDGSLVWYVQSYHGITECGFANSGIVINGVQYPLEQTFPGSDEALSPTIFAQNASYLNPVNRQSYAIIHTPFLGTTLNVQPYSTNVCWSSLVTGSGNFVPPPPPVCTTFPVNGFTNTVSLPGNNNGTACDPTDDTLPVTVTVSHQSCGSITGDGKFSLVLDPGGANIPYGPYSYSTGITTNVALLLPYGFNTATQLEVIDNDFPGSQVTHSLSGIAGTQFLGVPDTQKPVITCPADILTYNVGIAEGTASISIPSGGSTNGWSPWNYNFTDPTPSGSTITGIDLTFTAVDQGWGGTGDNAFMYVSGKFIGAGVLLHNSTTHTINYSGSIPGYVHGGTNLLQMYFTGYPGWVGYWRGGQLTIHYQKGTTCVANLTISAPIASDNCSVASITNDFTGTNNASGDYPIGVTKVTWTATDPSGNSTSCVQTITVDDNTPPVIITKNITVQLDANGSVSILPKDVDGGTKDNCGIASLALDKTIFDCTNVGVNTVTLTATDVHGNVSSGTATVTVEDHIAPVVITQNVTIQLDASGHASVSAAEVNNGSTDACGVASLSLNKSTFDCSNVGPNAVNLTVTDTHGNVSTATATVTVEDHVAPVAIAQNVTVQLDATGNGSTTAVAVNNGSSDACGIATLSLDKTAFTCSNFGPNPVILTVTDVHGNVSTATATVTVEDHIAPVAIAQNVTVQLDATGNGSTTTVAVNNGSSDACGIATLSLDKTTFDCSNFGPNPVILTVTDVHGNVSTATATVTVEDHVAPVAIAQNVTVQLDATGNGSTTAVAVNNGSSDACGIASLSLDKTTFDCSNFGPNPVILTVTDVHGNVSTATAVITVQDNIAPTLVVPASITKLNDPGVCGAVINIGLATATDNCTVASIVSNAPAFYPVGTTIVKWTGTDASGNATSANQTVTVYNNNPVINVLTVSKPVLLGDAVGANATYTDNNVIHATWSWGDGTTSPGEIGSSTIDGDHVYAQTGLYDVTLVIEDACGKTDQKTFSYTIVFNPCAGKVTGGGWIDLTAGSYPAKPMLKSKAMFEFELEYDGNALENESKIKFQIKETKFEFKSNLVNWLMVNNDQAIFSGSGTINGTGNYSFVASIIDGDVVNLKKSDSFRIVIKDIAGNVVFDNQAGNVDAARASQKISSGSIQIHKGCGEKEVEKADTKKSASIVNNDFNVKLYPNPVRDEINLNVQSNSDGGLTLEIFDMTGRIYLKSSKVDVFGGQVKVNVSNIGMVHGNYIMRVIDNVSLKSAKILFNKE